MAFRRQVIKKRSKTATLLYNFLLIIGSLFTLIIFAGFIFLNGNTIKEPLANLIQSKINKEVSLNKVEFSPLYPGTLRIQDFKIENEKIGEIYLELDLIKFIFDKDLNFEYLYLKNPSYNLKELTNLITTQKDFNSFKANRIRIDEIQIDEDNLKVEKANLNLYNVTYKDILSIASAQAHFEDGSLFNEKFKSISFNYKSSDNKLFFDDVNARISGGSVLCNLEYDIDTHNVVLKNTVISNLILKERTPFLDNFHIKADKIKINNIIYENKKKNLLISDIDGYINDLSLTDTIAFNFDGSISEVVKSDIKETLRNITTTASFIDDSYTISAQGLVSLGRFDVIGEYKKDSNTFNLYKLNLEKTKIELDDRLYSYIKDKTENYNFNIQAINIINAEFLSFINKLPVSIKDFSLSLTNLNIKDNSLSGNKAGLITFDAKSFLYSDLYLKKIFVLTTLTDNLITVSIPDLTFIKSSVAITGDFSLNKGNAYLSIKADDFNLSEINSNLLPNLFAGQINLDIELRSNDYKKFKENLTGKIDINSKQILVSKFGLDLINGGKLNNYSISNTKDLIFLLRDDDFGGENLSITSNIENGVIDNKLSLISSTSNIDGNIKYILNNNTIDGLINFTSKSKDSITNVELKKDINDSDVIYNFKALKRGSEMRPSLALDKLQEESDRNLAKDDKTLDTKETDKKTSSDVDNKDESKSKILPPKSKEDNKEEKTKDNINNTNLDENKKEII